MTKHAVRSGDPAAIEKMFENASEIKRFSRHLAAANTDIYTSEDKFYLNEGLSLIHI